MIIQTIQFNSISARQTGVTVTAKLWSGVTLAADLSSINEDANLDGQYTGTVTDLAAGDYKIDDRVNGYSVDDPGQQQVVTLLLADGTYVAAKYAELNSSTITAIAAAVWNALTSGMTTVGSIGKKLADWIAGSSGTGARTVTITIDDGVSPLQNATVRMTEGANTYIATTNSSGVAVFNMNDATYVISIAKSGYTFSGASLVVSTDVSHTYSMTKNPIATPSASNVARRSIPVTVIDRID